MSKYALIIDDYRTRVRTHGDSIITDCLREKDVLRVIEMSAIARDSNNAKHPHQNRIPNRALRKFADRALLTPDKLLAAETFEQIHSAIAGCKVKGIGDLAIYDTAHRIGMRLKVLPKVVYMHQGTKTGTQNYLRRKVREKFLDKSHFPHFQSLRCDQIEDILCIYKTEVMGSSTTKSKAKRRFC